MTKTLRLLLFIAVFGGTIIGVTSKHQAGKKLTIDGAIVGYDEIVPLANLTSAPQLEILIVRVTKPVKVEESRYIKVVYKHMQDRANLPAEMFDSKQQWRFALTKPDQAEQNCSGPVQHLKNTTGAESEHIPNDGNLPCYILRPDDFKLLGKTK